MSARLELLAAERERRHRRAVAKRRRMIGAGVGMLAPTFQAAGTVFGQTTGISFSRSWPTHQANDIGLLFAETANEPVATPSGWTAIANGSQGIGTAGSVTATRLQVFWRRALGSLEAAADLGLVPGDHAIAVILTVRGCIATGDPIDVSAGDTTADVDTSAVSIPGATTTVGGTLVVAAVSNQTDSSGGASGVLGSFTNADLVGLNQRGQAQSNAGNGGGFNVAMGTLASAGAYGLTTATIGTASRQGRVSFALKPA